MGRSFGSMLPSHPLSMGSREDEVSVRGFLRELRWIAPFVLLILLGFWGVDVVRGGSSILLWTVLLGWVFFTVSLGPMIWVRGLPSRAPGFWRAFGLALLWCIGCLIVFGIGYGLVVWTFGPPWVGPGPGSQRAAAIRDGRNADPRHGGGGACDHAGMDDQGLIGRWSMEARYGATSMEDEELVFKPDGTGWCEYARPIFSRFTLFRWSASAPGRLRVVPYRAAHSQQGRASGRIVDEARVPRPVEVGYRIALEDVRETRGAGMLLVLRVDLPIAELRDGAYGLLTRETPPGGRPYLPWLDGPRSA